ncbi:amino acid adenylation domain-containing protein, partial [Rhodococcus sp. NPDC049939]|uniref:amino acid adenylation domain-containing protein n=1 Tax=Rhodococcus sp. NPDC049939 TaxID=3155511 RepID=UPI0033DEBA1A
MSSLNDLDINSARSVLPSSNFSAPSGMFPLSAAQRGIWFAQGLLDDVPIVISQYVEFTDLDLDVDLLADSALVAARELGTGVLRIVERDGEPLQVIDESLGLEWMHIDLTAEEDPRAAAHAWMRTEYSTPIDLLGDRLIHTAILHLGDHHYYLYSRIHHIALDGYGAMTFNSRTAELYSARVQGRDPARFKASSLREIIEDEARYRTSSRFEKDRQYWSERSRDFPDPISLAGRAAAPGLPARVISKPLPPATEAAVQRLLVRQDAMFAAVAVAAVAAFLSRLTGEDDVVLSLPVSARTTARLRNSGGMVSNVVPIRLQVDDQATVADLVRRAQLELTGALRHQRYRHEDIRRDAGISGGYRGLFGPSINIMLFHEELHGGNAVGQFNVLTTGPVEDLAVNLYPSVGGQVAQIDFEANPNLYTEDQLRGHHTRFLEFLTAFADAPADRRVVDLEILDEDEAAHLVPSRGPAGARVRLLPDLLAEGVAAAPHSVAIRASGAEITYQDLDTRSNRLARLLIESGAGPEIRVALSLSRSVESLVAFWAVAKSGAAFVPIDPDLPIERISRMLADSGALVGVTTRDLRTDLPDTTDWIVLDDEATNRRCATLPDDPITDNDRRSVLREGNAAYLIFTSGSTGVPKGVVIAHTGLANNVAADSRPELGVTAQSRVLRFSSASFDASVFEMIQAFSAGATMVVAPPDMIGGSELVDLLRDEQVTHMIVAPTVMNTVDPRSLEHLEAVLVGGDICTPDLVERFGNACRFTNGYGPSENTILSTTLCPLQPGDAITIGTPISGVSAVVLDRRLRPVPAGVVGELYLAGPGLARGYHDRRGFTANRFVANPFGEPGQRLYRSGDEVRWVESDTAGGYALEFIGRSDSQVKIRGFRIELGEIDTALLTLDGINFAATIVHQTDSGTPALVSYVRLDSGCDFDPQAIAEQVATTVPSHMVPAVVMQLSEIPVTAAGKLDRSALPAPRFGSASRAFRPPSTPDEELLAGLVAEALGIEKVSVDDSLFALGGDSIIAMQIAARAKKRGLSFTARTVFERKTIAEIARAAAVEQVTEGLEEFEGGGVGRIPLTPVMYEMLERAFFDGGYFGDFSQTLVLMAPVEAGEDRLRTTLAAVMERHDTLRSRFYREGSSWVLETASIENWFAGGISVDLLVSRVPTTAAPGSLTFNELVESESAAAARRLDPERGIMIQVVWLDPRSHEVPGRLLIVAHHLVVDGVSWRVLLPDFATAWLRIGAGQLPDLAPVGTSFRRWAHGVRDKSDAGTHIGEMTHWLEVLSGRDPLIGSRAIDPSIDTMRTTKRITIEVSPPVTEAVLAQLPDVFSCRIHDGLLTALAMAIVEWRRSRGVDERSVLLTLEGHGRVEEAVAGADLARTVGWFTSAFPVRLTVRGVDLAEAFGGGREAGVLIKTIKEQLVAVPAHGVGFGVLRQLDDTTRTILAALPAPQISFNYLGRADGQSNAEEDQHELGWTLDPLALNQLATSGSRMTVAAAVDINALVVDAHDGPRLTATFDFPTGVLRDAEVAALADLWRRALDGLATHALVPGAGGLTPSDLPLVSVNQRQIERWERRYPTLRDVWSLSPLQSGLLFHATIAAESVDVYTAQLRIDLEGAVDGARLRAAAARVLARHPSLRAAFVYDETGEPAQLVVDDVEVPWREVDLCVDGTCADTELARLLDEDRFASFDLTRPPLVRLLLIRTEPARYVLAMTNHHIILDGWSMPLLVRELLVDYAAGDSTTAFVEPPSFRTYLDWLAHRDLDASRRAWDCALAGFEEATLLAPGVSAVRNDVPAEIDINLPDNIIGELTAFVARLGVTVNTVIQAGWGLLLSRLLSRDDIVFGATVSGRPPQLPEVESILGLFINTVPIRVRLDPDETLAQLLTRLQAEQASLVEHHHLGLGEIQSCVGLGNLFDTLSVFESYPVDKSGLADTDIAGMRVTMLDVRDATHYPLTLLSIQEPHLRLSLRYQPGLFDHDTAATAAGRLTGILEAIVNDAGTTVGGLDLFTPGERELVLETWNTTSHTVPHTTLADLFADQVIRTPDAPAVVFDRTVLSYAEFDARTNRLARYLIGAGVGPESLVGVALTRSVDLLVAIYAVVKSGGAYVPIDPDQPAERIAHVVAIAEPALILTCTVDRVKLPASVEALALDVLDVSEHSAHPIGDGDRVASLRPGNPAYVIFTSGSTGEPKGVTVPHEGIVNRLLWMQQRYPIGPKDAVLQKTPTTFDVSVWELFWPLQTGARVVVAEPDGHREPRYLERVIRERSVTTVHFVPSMLEVFLAGADVAGCDSLRQVFTSGETLAPATATRLHRVSDAQLHNLYGPTEASVDVTSYETGPGESVVPIGGPVWNTRVYVLDARLQPVPVGVAGELYLGGVQVARGYVGRADLTAERFVADPFGGPGARLYRTGDLVRWSREGNLEFLGRTDFQVKVRGLRIELGEIESVLVADDAVSQAVVVVHEGEFGQQLVGYVVPAAGCTVEVEAVRAAVGKRLPRYMVPDAVVVLEVLPLGSSGKLDRRALPAPVWVPREFRAPTTPVQEIVAGVFA